MTAEQIIVMVGAALLTTGILMMKTAKPPRKPPRPFLYAQGWRIARYPGCITCEGAEEAGQLILHQRRDHRSVYYEEF